MLDRTGPRVDSRLPEWHSMETGLNWTPACLVLVGQCPIRDLSVNLVLSLFLFFFFEAQYFSLILFKDHVPLFMVIRP
jgi:hypothetical protein